MKILQVHNRYINPGGEDTVLALEAQLLRDYGHQVQLLDAQNFDDGHRGLPAKLKLARNAIWSLEGTSAMAAALQRYQPDVVHVHNTFYQLSPAVLRIATQRGVAVVQTLHNFRLLCANGLLLRQGRPCELCIDGGRWNALRHRCYRDSMAGSAVVSLTGAVHLRAGTYAQRGMRVIALTEFARTLFLRGGLDERVLRVKPHFVYPHAEQPLPLAKRDRRVVFVGRLAEEKGVDLLLNVWRRVAPPGWTLEMIGDGELRCLQSSTDNSVRWLGWLSPEDVMGRVASARFLVMASRWYEGFGMVLIESFSAATPVIVPKMGAMAELVAHGVNGLHFAPGSEDAMCDALTASMALPDNDWESLSTGALDSYMRRFSPEPNYGLLMDIYAEALNELAS